jgi:hypothetical protein
MRLEWNMDAAAFARARNIQQCINEDWDAILDEREEDNYLQRGTLLILNVSCHDDTLPWLSLEGDTLVYEGDRLAFQLHGFPVVLEIFDAQARQECPDPDFYDTTEPYLDWWQTASEALDEAFTASRVFPALAAQTGYSALAATP